MSIMVCKHCGSDDVWRDATAVWDGRKWELDEVFDYSHCNKCDGKTTLVRDEDEE